MKKTNRFCSNWVEDYSVAARKRDVLDVTIALELHWSGFKRTVIAPARLLNTHPIDASLLS